jgi:hypothetical protein
MTASLLLSACAQPVAPSQASASCTAPLKPALEVRLYFGRDKPAGGEVSDAEWLAFVDDTVTPRFPAGLSAAHLDGQYREPTGAIVRERGKLLVLVVFDAPAHHAKVSEIIEAYARRFGQYSVLRVEQSVCASV